MQRIAEIRPQATYYCAKGANAKNRYLISYYLRSATEEQAALENRALLFCSWGIYGVILLNN